jgi:ABC-2 type transport system ATP-binding protein
MPGTGPSAIITENLTKRFGARTVVDGVSLEVEAGQVFGFLGPNGAGKTTTIGILLGLVRPDAGRAVLLGHDVSREPAAALRQVGAMLEPAFYPYLSGRDNLRLLARGSHIPERRVDEVLALVDLVQRGGDRFATYSRGMRQRLGIASAFLNEPRLLIMDEPTEGLDPAGQHEIHELVRALAREGRTIFFSSHVLSEVEQLCERVAILNEGRLVVEGPVATLLGGAKGVTVRVAGGAAGGAARAAELLRAAEGVAGVVQQGELLLVDAPAARAAALNTLLNAHGVSVAEIHAGERHLEEVFLELTQGLARRRGAVAPRHEPSKGGA